MLRTKGMPESTAIFSVEAAGHAHNQTNDFVNLGGGVNHNADLSIKVDRRILNAWCSFLNYRPSAPLELKIRMLIAKVQDSAVRLCHVEPARVPLRHAVPSPPQVPDSLYRLAKERLNNHPISYLDTLMKTGSESIGVVMRRRRILFAGSVARMEDMRLPKCMMFGELVGGAGCVGR